MDEDKKVKQKLRTIAEGRSWFEYIKEELEEMSSPLDNGEELFFLAIGLLGQHADFDEDDVDYPPGLEEE